MQYIHIFSNSLSSIHFTRFIEIVYCVPLRTFLDRFKVWKKRKKVVESFQVRTRLHVMFSEEINFLSSISRLIINNAIRLSSEKSTYYFERILGKIQEI